MKKVKNARFFPMTKHRIFTSAIAVAVIFLVCDQFISPNSQTMRRLTPLRKLSRYLGNGKCEWTAPTYEVPENITFTKTLIAGFPSGDKRLTFVQMEALTGLSARDEWDFAFLGMTNQPFIKANYPHHEGIWGWGQEADQVVMVVRNIRRSMVEYHDILWDIGYAKTFEEASEKIGNLYSERPPLKDFEAWRDERVLDEIHWYGWFIDYYMEDGLFRDIFTHKITTPEHWYMLMQPTRYSRSEVEYDRIVGKDTFVTQAFDPHCLNDVTAGCKPKEIISAERLVETGTGPTEGRKIAQVIENNTGIEDYMIEEDAWGCIWEELIVRKKGLKTFIDREGVGEYDYNFSEEMLDEMLKELHRLIVKYSGSLYSTQSTAVELVELLQEHYDLIATELAEVKSGERKLTKRDFLGPKTRKRMFETSSAEE